MKRILFLLCILFAVSSTHAQWKKDLFGKKNRFEKYLSSKKLGTLYRTVKDSDKDEFFQQYFLVRKMEELAAYPHLSKIKPEVLYTFVKEIYPPISTKELSADGKQLRKDAYTAINYFFLNKDWNNPNLLPNVESYVDPGNKYYFLKVNPESVKENIPKEIYSYTSYDERNGNPTTRYFWWHDKKLQKINIFPPKEQEKFWNRVHSYLPGYTISDKPAEFSKPFKDQGLYVIIPFPTGMNNIEYRTKDFKEFILSRYKKSNGIWVDIEQ